VYSVKARLGWHYEHSLYPYEGVSVKTLSVSKRYPTQNVGQSMLSVPRGSLARMRCQRSAIVQLLKVRVEVHCIFNRVKHSGALTFDSSPSSHMIHSH